MKWNIGIVLCLAILLTLRYFVIENRFRSEGGQNRLKIQRLVIEDAIHNSKPTVVASNNDNKTEQIGEKRKKNGFQISLHSKRPFVQKRVKFQPFERIYIYLVFDHIKVGKHNLSTHWLSPQGKVAQRLFREFDLNEDTGSYGVYFWFELIRNGAFTRMFTGNEFSSKVYGVWRVITYLNGKKIDSREFTVTDG